MVPELGHTSARSSGLRQAHPGAHTPEIQRQTYQTPLALYGIQAPQAELAKAQNMFDPAVDRLDQVFSLGVVFSPLFRGQFLCHPGGPLPDTDRCLSVRSFSLLCVTRYSRQWLCSPETESPVPFDSRHRPNTAAASPVVFNPVVQKVCSKPRIGSARLPDACPD